MSIFIITVLVILLVLISALQMVKCVHKYSKVSFRQEYCSKSNLRYSVRIYECVHCKKRIEVDTRHGDPYE